MKTLCYRDLFVLEWLIVFVNVWLEEVAILVGTTKMIFFCSIFNYWCVNIIYKSLFWLHRWTWSYAPHNVYSWTSKICWTSWNNDFGQWRTVWSDFHFQFDGRRTCRKVIGLCSLWKSLCSIWNLNVNFSLLVTIDDGKLLQNFLFPIS